MGITDLKPNAETNFNTSQNNTDEYENRGGNNTILDVTPIIRVSETNYAPRSFMENRGRNPIPKPDIFDEPPASAEQLWDRHLKHIAAKL